MVDDIVVVDHHLPHWLPFDDLHFRLIDFIRVETASCVEFRHGPDVDHHGVQDFEPVPHSAVLPHRAVVE